MRQGAQPVLRTCNRVRHHGGRQRGRVGFWCRFQPRGCPRPRLRQLHHGVGLVPPLRRRAVHRCRWRHLHLWIPPPWRGGGAGGRRGRHPSQARRRGAGDLLPHPHHRPQCPRGANERRCRPFDRCFAHGHDLRTRSRLWRALQSRRHARHLRPRQDRARRRGPLRRGAGRGGARRGGHVLPGHGRSPVWAWSLRTLQLVPRMRCRVRLHLRPLPHRARRRHRVQQRAHQGHVWPRHRLCHCRWGVRRWRHFWWGAQPCRCHCH
mmetsp:Transcript_10371/g.24335  ORF Transcript_10371/g.24335 Transcript_10371/m.24335 type:complete len:264 (+) Transcript_10371:525-1316(+)